MIKAEEARRRTLLNTKLKKIITDIEKNINCNIELGHYSTSVIFHQDLDQYLLEVLIKELKSLGYWVTYEPSKPLPSGCPTDQWDFNSYLNISWEE